MVGLNIAQLPWPEPAFRPDLTTDRADGKLNFQSASAAMNEDATRAKLLRRAAEQATNPENRRRAEKLANRLDYSAKDAEWPDTMACSAYMRDQKIRVGGALWQLMMTSPYQKVSKFATIGQGMEFTTSQLWETDPNTLRDAFRSNLNRCGATKADGYLIAFLDGEYEPTGDVLRLHWHGVAAGEMIDVLDNLRGTPKHASKRDKSAKERSVQRVRMTRKPLINLPDPLTYLLKSFWPSRWEGDINGEHKRQNGRRRIPEPLHSQLLLWFDLWELKDITLLMGLRVGANGLIITKPPYTNGDGK